jgi:hypothetical protein
MNYDAGNKSELQTKGLATVLNERESALKGGNKTQGTVDMKMLICMIGGIVILLIIEFFSACRRAPPA